VFYVLQHIFMCLLAAAALGALLAWFLRGMGFTKKLSELEEEWTGKLGTLEADNGRLTTQWKEAEGTLGGWKHKFASLEGDHNRLQADFSGVSARLPILETAIAGWTAKAATWDADRQKLQADLRACADARSSLEVQLAEWNTRARAWDTERATLRANLSKAVSDDAADDTAYEKMITTLRADLAGAQLKVKNAEVAANEWQTKHMALDAQLKTVMAERDRALAGYKKAVADDAADDAAYEKTIAALRSENAALQAQVTSLAKERDRAVAEDKVDDAAYERVIAQLRGEISGLKAASLEDMKFRQSVAELPAELAALKTSLTSAQESGAAYEKQIAALRAELAAANARLEKAVAEDKTEDANYERVIAQLRGEIANLKAAAKTAADDDTIEDANFRNTIENLRAEVQGLQAKLKREQEADRADDAVYEQRIAALTADLAVAHARATAAEAKATATAPMAMAAAAGVGAATTTAVDDGRVAALSGRLQSFVMRTQREGWGDIERIEGIGPVYGQKLRSVGIVWVKDLLEEGADAAGRVRIAEESGIKRELILKWVNAADLLRVPGVTPDWAELLEASGVDTVKELRNRVPENLQKKLEETNPIGNYARTVPDTNTVRGWIEAAKKMDPKVTH
jgi:predicted  nucleic acid-binding Zn-ribbon protein